VFVAMRRNVAELPALVALLGRLGVDELRVQNLSHSFSDTDPAGGYHGIRSFVAAQALWTGDDREAVERAFGAARQAADQHGLALWLPVVHLNRSPPVRARQAVAGPGTAPTSPAKASSNPAAWS
jgi:hypothetical protein